MSTAPSPNTTERERRERPKPPARPVLEEAEHALVDAQLETLYVACLLAHLQWAQKHPKVTNGAKAALMMRTGKELVQHFLPTVLPTGVDWDAFYTAVARIPRIEEEMGDAIRELSPAVMGPDKGRSGLKRAPDFLGLLPKRQATPTEGHTHAPVPTGTILADMSTVQRLVAIALTDAETPGVLIPILTVFAVFFARWYARWKRDENQTYYEALVADGDLHKDAVLLLTTCLLVWAVLAGQADYSALGPVEGNPLVVALTKDVNIAVLQLNSRNDAYVREMFRAQQVVETLLDMPRYQAARQSFLARGADLAFARDDYTTEGILEELSKKYAGDPALMGTATWNEVGGVANVPAVRPFLNMFINQPLPRDQYEAVVRAANLALIQDVRADPRSYASTHKCALVLRVLSLLLAVLFGAPALQEIREGPTYDSSSEEEEDHEDAAFDVLSVVEHVFARNGGHRLR